jgi:hypothetical protein
MIEELQCGFCLRQDTPLVGPFFNLKKQSDSRMYFHNDCLEINDFTFFDFTKGKWVNIAKALDQLVKKNQSMCLRCHKVGATTKCQASCNNRFHGYICSTLSMVSIGELGYECLICKNRDNYDAFQGKFLMTEKELEVTKINMPRDTVL